MFGHKRSMANPSEGYVSVKAEDLAQERNDNGQPFMPHADGKKKLCSWCGKNAGDYSANHQIWSHGDHYDFCSLVCLVKWAQWKLAGERPVVN